MAGGGRQRRAHARDVVLFEPNGRPFNASATVNGWRGGESESRRTRSWIVSDLAINAMLAGDVSELRRRSRDVVRKSAWAKSAQQSFVANCVGSGIVPRPLTEDDDLRRELLEAWDEWVDQCDADGNLDFYGLQALACSAYREGGDCFIRFRQRRPSDGLCVPLQLQVVEAELVDPSYDDLTLSGGHYIRAGIEFDPTATRTHYHMWREHPGDYQARRNVTRARVPADSVMHLFECLRPGQIRGVPGLASALATLWELDKYNDAELMRKQVAAMFAGFVNKPDMSSNPLDAGNAEGEDDDERPLAALEPGTMQELGPGESVTFSSPSDVGASYEPFLRSQLRQVASSGGNTYEQLTGDMNQVNFSSARVSLIEFWRRMGQQQRAVMVKKMCRPTWARFVEAAVTCGRIALPQDPRLVRQMTRASWALPAREYVDPDKEVRAIVARRRAGLTSRSRVLAELQLDAEALDREIANDNQRADDLGLRFDGDGRVQQGGSMGQGAMGGRGTPPKRGAPDEFDGGDEEVDDQADADTLAWVRRAVAARRAALPLEA